MVRRPDTTENKTTEHKVRKTRPVIHSHLWHLLLPVKIHSVHCPISATGVTGLHHCCWIV